VDESGSALPPQYLDVVVSSVKDTAPFGFSVQVLSTDSTWYRCAEFHVHKGLTVLCLQALLHWKSS
jgi:hypothetical protein